MMFLIRIWTWRILTQKDSVESAKYEIKKNLYLYLQFLDVFFMDPDFPDRIRIFGLSGSGLMKKKIDPDPEKKSRYEILLF